ncbi:MAG: hypothetical protein BMS9Abin15_0111 [Gammaproteobacteria bacterium]|nr:MAG: hypothetical protein BMS9Abin15_0111 [Gammaproteobacteria bacterium]
MRYHEDSTPDTLGSPAGDSMLIATAVYCIVIGIGALIAGIRAKQRWIALREQYLRPSVVSIPVLRLQDDEKRDETRNLDSELT